MYDKIVGDVQLRVSVLEESLLVVVLGFSCGHVCTFRGLEHFAWLTTVDGY